MHYPKIKFFIDSKVDALSALSFLARNKNDYNFLNNFFPDNIQFIFRGFNKKEVRKIITAYTKTIYRKREIKIKRGVSEIIKQWSKKEKTFFRLTNQIFKGFPWPKGEYIGYASIFHMFPRNVKQKYFFFPYEKKWGLNPIRTIFHEMLHFIFFAYLEEQYGLKESSKIPSKPKNYIWQISEAFNNVIQDWKPYNKEMVEINHPPYKGTEKLVKKMKKVWENSEDIHKVLKAVLK